MAEKTKSSSATGQYGIIRGFERSLQRANASHKKAFEMILTLL